MKLANNSLAAQSLFPGPSPSAQICDSSEGPDVAHIFLLYSIVKSQILLVPSDQNLY